MSFTPAQLLDQLAHLPATQRYWVAYSGGCDSTVLLHALAGLRQQLPAELHALHVNHNLHAAAPEWAAQCRRVCDSLAIPLTEVEVDARAAKGESPEAAARAARYRIFSEVLRSGDGLLLAHHRDDQAETLLLQLLRGSGPRGLAAMPKHRPLGEGWLGRPLLDFSRQDLCRYAQAEQLEWIDDPSNFDTDFDRNFLRQQVLPLLQERWPAALTTLARSAEHQADAAELLQQLAEEDWQLTAGPQVNTLRIEALLRLSPERQRNVLRYWINTINQLPLPDSQRVARILTEVIPAAVDAKPCIRWTGGQIRRYAGLLHVLANDPVPMASPLQWDLKGRLELGDGRALQATRGKGEGLRADLTKQGTITVRFRQGGEVCRPAGRGHQHSLKNLFQEWSVPPWERNRIPLLYVNEDIAEIVGYCRCEPYQAEGDSVGIIVSEADS